MKFILDEHGDCIADARMAFAAQSAIQNQKDLHVANEAFLTVFRAELCKIPVANRPKIEWKIYGKEVHFDDMLRSMDAWDDPRMNIAVRASEEILFATLKK